MGGYEADLGLDGPQDDPEWEFEGEDEAGAEEGEAPEDVEWEFEDEGEE